MSAELVLHLELDGFEVVDGKEIVKDASGHNHIGALQGEVDIVVDDTFGACVSFDGNPGNYITVPSDNLLKSTGDVTVQAWVYVSQEASSYVRLVGRGSDPRDYGLWAVSGGGWLFQRLATRPQVVNKSCQIDSPTRALHTWYHLAGVIEGTKGALYLHDLQGKCIGYKEIHDMPSGPAFDTDEPLTIGYGAGLGYPAHTGRIAHARVYNGARTQAEIERDIASDRLALVPFRKSHPIDFHLYDDDDDQAVLYISDDTAEHNLRLELHNTSAQSIQLHNGKGDAASEDNHHFALRFRPGTLSDSTLKALVAPPQERAKILKQAEQWDLYFPPTLPAANEAAVLYLLYKGPATSFEPNEHRTVTLQRMSAAPGSGARGTQVELLPHQLTAQGGDATPITGNRTQYMHITNRIGHKYIPLHVWFEGGNTVLNDCTTVQELTVRISNGSYKDITLIEKASRFLISFDAGTEAWALGESVEVLHNGEGLPPIDVGQGVNMTEWELKFPERKTLVRRGDPSQPAPENPIKGIEITIRVTKTPQAPGHANVYLRYEGIPGYQDGQFILTVEKSPLVVHNGNVAIGPVDTPAKLSVFGTVYIGGATYPARNSLVVDGDIRSNALQLYNAGPIIRHIFENAGDAVYANGNEALPTVQYTTHLIFEILAGQILGDSKPLTILPPNQWLDLAVDPEHKPSFTVSFNNVHFGGRLILSTKSRIGDWMAGNVLRSEDGYLADCNTLARTLTPMLRLVPPPVRECSITTTINRLEGGQPPQDFEATLHVSTKGDLSIVLTEETCRNLFVVEEAVRYTGTPPWQYPDLAAKRQCKGWMDLSCIMYQFAISYRSMQNEVDIVDRLS